MWDNRWSAVFFAHSIVERLYEEKYAEELNYLIQQGCANTQLRCLAFIVHARVRIACTLPHPRCSRAHGSGSRERVRLDVLLVFACLCCRYPLPPPSQVGKGDANKDAVREQYGSLASICALRCNCPTRLGSFPYRQPVCAKYPPCLFVGLVYPGHSIRRMNIPACG